MMASPERDPMVSFRLPPELLAAVDECAGTERMTRSHWLRELAGIVAGRRLRLEALLGEAPQVAPVRVQSGLGASRVVVPGRCIHPVHLVQTFATYRECACGRRWQL